MYEYQHGIISPYKQNNNHLPFANTRHTEARKWQAFEEDAPVQHRGPAHPDRCRPEAEDISHENFRHGRGRAVCFPNEMHWVLPAYSVAQVKAKSKYWYFISLFKRVKRINGEILCINEVSEDVVG